MKLYDLLEEVKVGKERYSEEKNKEALLEVFDEDMGDYKVSKLLSFLTNKMESNINENNSKVIRLFRKLENKIKMYEDKIEDRGYITEAYARMKMDNLTEDYNKIAEEISRNKVQRSLDKEILAHSVALVRFQINELSKEAEARPDLVDLYENFEPLVSKEYKIIEETINE